MWMSIEKCMEIFYKGVKEMNERDNAQWVKKTDTSNGKEKHVACGCR